MTELSDAEALALVKRMREGSTKEKAAWSEAWADYVMQLQTISGNGITAISYAANDMQAVFLGLAEMADNHGNPVLAIQILRDTAAVFARRADDIAMKTTPTAPILTH